MSNYLMKIQYLLICVLTLVQMPFLQAQDCAQSYSKAERAYENGHLNEVEGLLVTCMRTFTADEKVKAYRLITLAHIFSDRLDEADDSYARLLDADPDYEPSKNDPIEYRNLHNSFRTWPTASVGLVAGPNITFPSIANYHGVDNTALQEGNYSSQVSFQAGITGEYYLGKRLSVSPQLLLVSNQLKFEDNLFDFSTLDYTENQSWIQTPIMFRYYLNTKRANLHPFISLGASASFLRRSTASVIRDVVDGRDVTGPDVVVSELRKERNYSALGAFGIEKHFKHIHASIKFSYQRDLMKQVDKDRRYSIPELVYRYGYVDNDYRTSYFVLSVGISYVFYNHKRIKPRIPDFDKKNKESLVKKKRK